MRFSSIAELNSNSEEAMMTKMEFFLFISFIIWSACSCKDNSLFFFLFFFLKFFDPVMEFNSTRPFEARRNVQKA